MWMRAAIGITFALSFMGTAAFAEDHSAGHHRRATSVKASPHAAAKTRAMRQHKEARAASRHRSRTVQQQEAEPQSPPDEYVGPMQVIGAREVGSAAWYGGRHIGRRTASGNRLDAVHATAAHRSLPLDSLVRVTNLTNGHSIICKITDRGPVSHSLLIDVSPAVADRLDMKRAGIARVSIEPVAPAAKTTH
jgi:rare lipoprotein A